MNETKNILLKLFILLTCGVGWSSGAWAALPASQNWGNSSFTKLGDGNYKFYAPYYMSEPITVTTAGNLSVNYRYTGGSWAFPGVGFDLVDDNGVVKYSSYSPEAIGSNKNKTYTVANVAPGSYNIRYMTSRYGNDGDFLGRTDPRGTITVSGTAAAGFTPTITSWTHQGWSPVTSADPGLWEGLSIYNKYLAVANIHTYSSAATVMTGGDIIVVNFQKTSGSANLSVKGVELLDASNKIVAADYRDATVSTTGKYTLNVPADGTYTVRTIVQTATENNVNCAGTITYSAPETWTVKINDGYKLVYNGRSYGNNETVAIDIDTHDYRGITVNAPSTKAVWGPVVDNTNKTITFEISNPVNPQAGRWYKVQVLPTSGNLGANLVDAFNGRIKAQGVKGEYIYVQNAEQPSNRSDYKAIHCFMGMPENEAAAYVYVNYFTNNNILLQHINGRSINQEGKQQTTAQSSSDVLLTRENSGSYTGSYYWDKLQPFSLNDADIAHYFGRSSNSTNNFHTYFTEVDPSAKFDMYRVIMQYEGTSMAATNAAITYSGTANHGFNSVYHGGYFFFTKGTTLSSTNFSVPGDGETITIDPSAKTITVTLPLPKIVHRTPWTVDKVNSTDASSIPPVNTGFLQQDLVNKGMKENTNTTPATKIQNVPVFEMTEYIKPGNSKNIWLPTCNTNGSNSSLWSYQRWYDYRTEGPVNSAIYNFPSQKPNGMLFQNGFVTGAIYGDFVGKNITVNLPVGIDSYDIALDHSRFEDYRKDYDGMGNLLEPTISQRVIYHLVDANVMAQKLEDVPADKWLEEYTIHFPSYKMGSKDARNGFDIIGLDQTFGNYWYYASAANATSKNPTQVTSKNDFTFDVTCTDPNVNVNSLGIGVLEKNNNTMPSALNLQLPSTFAGQRFIMFNYPANRKFADKTELVIKVSVHGKRVAKFTLIFDDGTEPLPILDVIGKDSNGNRKSTRSTSAMIEQYGLPIAKVTFDGPQIPFRFPTGMTTSNLSDNTYNWSSENSARYGLPVSNEYTDYSFFGGGGGGNNTYMAMGEYRLESSGNGTSGRFKIRPIEEYEAALNDPSGITTPGYKQYFAFADVSEQPGKIISLPFSTTLCKGQRIFMQGWVGSATSTNDNGQQQSGIILNVYGIKNNQRTLVYSYCPGIISSAIEKDGVIYRSVENDFSGYRQTCNDNSDWNNQGFLIWKQVNCSFLVSGEVQYDSYQLEVDNNSYSSTGCDVVIDNFYVFVNPPKGNVDFTTPLCSDKVRHAKIYADYDMLKSISNVNESNPNAKINVTVCFLEADVFDNYSNGSLKISDIFDVDDMGNHNLKAQYTEDASAKALINAAFGAALVGTRQLSSDENHGFHVYEISQNYESIPVYAYTDSESDKVYRETVDGISRVVFKVDVIRGEQNLLADGRWPHMRPSTTYYLVFSSMKATQDDIDLYSTATDIFHIHESCSFFGKFKTKDPLHVILDNADIEADLPVKAVCHGESVAFSFDMPAMKMVKENNKLKHPIVDEAYCTSDGSLDGQIVPSTYGANHYKHEPLFETEAVYGVIRDLPYDWWMGGKYDETHTYRATLQDYLAATHPSYVYNQPEDIAHKKHGQPVKIAQAMEDFRFYYPDFGKDKTDINGNCSLTDADWATVTVHPYNSETGYGLLQSEINTIKDLVTRGIIMLHRNTYNMSLTANKSEQLTNDELSKMTSNELNSQILALALELNKNVSWGEDKKPLKALESKVLSMISDAGKKQLTFEEFSNFTYAQLQGLADLLSVDRNLSEGELRKAVEAQLRAKTDAQLLAFAEANFPDVGHEKRAYLVIRALNIMNDETLKNDIPEEKKQDAEYIRSVLRDKMITIFSDQDLAVLKKMWNDVSAKLTPEESAELLNGNNPETMDETQLATLVEQSLGKITDRIIGELKADKYIHFTLIPITPSQESFVDEQYLFCPEPRGVKVRITSHEPKMLDGFADMPYPEDMENVPVRLGLKQISESKASAAKTLRIPVRGLKQAAKNGVKAVRVADTGYGNYLFLVETNDPAYKQNGASAGGDGLTEAVNDDGTYKRMIGKVVEEMAATYPTKGNLNPDNYLTVKFEDDMNFREGYTYRVGLNFMEYDSEDHPTISCYGTMLLDMKIVPEYQKWTADVNTDWTNDGNWARADRDELNADNAATGSVIAGSTDITVAANYPTNEANKKSSSFVPMYFTNVLVDGDVDAPVLYTVTAASRGEKKFLQGLTSDDATQAQHIYDMEVAPSTGAWHDDNNYECTLFGTYVANGITFKPGSQLINAQHLTYNKAWVEYELQAGRWYTLSSPLQNTFAGEWYSPTDGGKQMTPHFYDITYQQGGGSQNLNDRFRPAYYQRSWDNGGNNVVYTKSNTDSDNYAYYIAADWSYVYNDVKKEYSNGAFSVLAETGYMTNKPADGKVLVRLPKADTGYTYFGVNSETGQKGDDVLPIYTKNEDGSITLNQDANPSKLFTDKLKNASSFTQTITNETEGNNFFLVANPFMANMDMDEFFAENSANLEPKFWIMTANGQEVSVRTENGWITTSDQVAALGKSAPLQGFFVKGKSNSKSVEITYTAAMQAESTATAPLQARPMATSNNQTLTINAQYGDITSTAIVAINGGASTDFVSTEDCETFIDSNIADLPTIYTVASGQAMTVNSVPAIDMLPLGIVSETDDNVEVSFSGFEGTLYLYDAQLKTTQTLTEGMTVAMPTNTSGRYFITVNPSTTGITTTTAETSSRKGVWTLSGKYCGTAVKNLAPGVYVVDGVKMVVR